MSKPKNDSTAILLDFDGLGIGAEAAAKLVKQCLEQACPKLAAAVSSTNAKEYESAYGGPVLYFP